MPTTFIFGTGGQVGKPFKSLILSDLDLTVQGQSNSPKVLYTKVIVPYAYTKVIWLIIIYTKVIVPYTKVIWLIILHSKVTCLIILYSKVIVPYTKVIRLIIPYTKVIWLIIFHAMVIWLIISGWFGGHRSNDLRPGLCIQQKFAYPLYFFLFAHNHHSLLFVQINLIVLDLQKVE